MWSQILAQLSRINWVEGVITLVIAGVYLLLYLIIRWYAIVKPNRLELEATVTSVRADLEWQSIDQSTRDAVGTLLDDASSRASGSEWLRAFLFGSWGQTRGGWQSLHKAKRLLVITLTSEQLKTQLRTLAEDLQAVGQPRANELAERIINLDTSSSSEAALRAHLDEAFSIVFADRDGGHADEDVAHSKALLLMMTAILLIVVLAAFQNAILFLLGALGGFLSRLSRSLGTEGITTHWVGLFLSPLAGALAGWGYWSQPC